MLDRTCSHHRTHWRNDQRLTTDPDLKWAIVFTMAISSESFLLNHSLRPRPNYHREEAPTAAWYQLVKMKFWNFTKSFQLFSIESDFFRIFTLAGLSFMSNRLCFHLRVAQIVWSRLVRQHYCCMELEIDWKKSVGFDFVNSRNIVLKDSI